MAPDRGWQFRLSGQTLCKGLGNSSRRFPREGKKFRSEANFQRGISGMAGGGG